MKEQNRPGLVPLLSLLCQNFDPFNGRQHYIEIFNRGKVAFEYSVVSNVPWLSFSKTKGTVNKDVRIFITLDESQLSGETGDGIIRVSGADKEVAIKVKAFNPCLEKRKTIQGFVESGGVVFHRSGALLEKYGGWRKANG
ncbi:MAG: BACON domain-containing protein [Bacteroidales bacterium]|nr:BACON domain-containing protein [Bacteroidales bacterium]